MAAVGAEVGGSFLLSSEAIGLFIVLLLLSLFLTALCSDCARQSFELQDCEVEKHPPVLINVVKLEESMVARENPILHEIQSDEKDVQTNGSTAGIKTRSDSDPASESTNEDDNGITFIPWRSHLGASQPQVLNRGPSKGPPLTSSSSDSAHIYHVVESSQSAAVASSQATNHKPAPAWHSENQGGELDEDLTGKDRNPTYARINRKERSPTPPPVPQPKEGQWAESSPPLLNRKTALET